MGVFDNLLKSDESIFRDEVALSYDYLPKMIKFREKEQHTIASCVKPLFDKRNGRNILVHGIPGIGKTVATRHVLNEINEHTEDIIPIYVNCWKKNTSFKVLLEICSLIGYNFTQNKNTQDLFNIIKEKLNKFSVAFCFDEVDKLESFDFLYFVLEDIYRSSVIMLTNYPKWHATLDERIRSRLTAEMLEFKPYSTEEIREILKLRLSYAFVSGVWENEAFNLVAEKTAKGKDIRAGLYLLKESGLIAESKSSKKINNQHVEEAMKKFDDFSIKPKEELEDDTQEILNLVKDNSGKKIGDLYENYKENGGIKSYKAFRRRIHSLADARFISVERQTGHGGLTTIVHAKEPEKRLTDF